MASAAAAGEKDKTACDAFLKAFTQPWKGQTGTFGHKGTGMVVATDTSVVSPFRKVEITVGGHQMECVAQAALALSVAEVAKSAEFDDMGGLATHIANATAVSARAKDVSSKEEMAKKTKRRIEQAINTWKAAYATDHNVEKAAATEKLKVLTASAEWQGAFAGWCARAFAAAIEKDADLRAFALKVADLPVAWVAPSTIPCLVATTTKLGSTQSCNVERWTTGNLVGKAFMAAALSLSRKRPRQEEEARPYSLDVTEDAEEVHEEDEEEEAEEEQADDGEGQPDEEEEMDFEDMV